MSYQEEITQGIELLKLCQRLQSEKDGIQRPEVGSIDKSKTLDTFARQVTTSVTYMASLQILIPMSEQLAALGRHLEREGKLTVDYGEDYGQRALHYLLSQHGLAPK